MSETEELEKRIRTLESQLAFLRGAASVVGLCVIAFLGYTVIDIPRQVKAAIGSDVVGRVAAFNAEYKTLKANGEDLAMHCFKDREFTLRLAKTNAYIGGLRGRDVPPGKVNEQTFAPSSDVLILREPEKAYTLQLDFK